MGGKLDRPGSDFDQNTTVLDLGGIGLQILAGRGRFNFSSRAIENRGMFRTFDGILYNQAFRQVHVFMCAKPVGAKYVVFVVAHDDEGSLAMIVANYVFGLDVVGSASVDPVGHPILLCQLCVTSETERPSIAPILAVSRTVSGRSPSRTVNGG